MIRALTTLAGLAAAAAILYFVSDVGDAGGSFWLKALVWAAAGLAIGVLYQAGGRRAPGLRTNVPLLVFAWLPWTLLTGAVVAYQAHNPVWLSNRARDVIPDSWLDRWVISLPAFALGVGLLFAFSLLEPRIGLRPPEPEPVVASNPYVPETPWQPPEERPTTFSEPVAEPERTPDSGIEQTAIQEPPTVLRLGEPENPVKVIEPAREDRAHE